MPIGVLNGRRAFFSSGGEASIAIDVPKLPIGALSDGVVYEDDVQVLVDEWNHL